MTPRLYHPPMQFCVLGPLSVSGARGEVEVYGGKERALLAHLVAAAGHVVTVDELTDSLWRDRPPRAPGKALQTYVLRLRNALEPDRRGVPTVVVTEGSGYRLAVRDHEVDALRFAQLAVAGRDGPLISGRAAEASATLREALALWRGAAYDGFEEMPFGRRERQRLDELRVKRPRGPCARPRSIWGATAAAVPELEQLVDRAPVARACLGRCMVLALVRAGRQGDALGALERARLRLADELGVDPGPDLPALHARVLAHDPDLLRLPTPAASDPALRPARSRPHPRCRTPEQAHAVELVRVEAGVGRRGRRAPAGRPGGAGRRHPRAAGLRAPRPEPAPVGRLSLARTRVVRRRGPPVVCGTGEAGGGAPGPAVRPTAWSPS